MAPMQVELVSPEREVWSGEADSVFARTTEGELGILPGHQPLLGTLVEAPLRIDRVNEEPLVAAVHGGFLSVTDAGVSVLAETLELADEIDVGRARHAWERAKGAPADDEEGQAAGRRATARLRAKGETL